MSRSAVAAIALLAAGVALIAGAWFDGTVMRDAEAHAAAVFNHGGVGVAWAVGSIGIAGSVLALGTIAWRSHSAAVGTAYAVVGAFFAFLPVLFFDLAARVNDAPPVLAQPVAHAVSQVYVQAVGPLNAVVIIGAGMLVAGLAVVIRSLRTTSATDASRALPPPIGQPVRP